LVGNPRRYRGLGLDELRRWLPELVAELAPEAAALGVALVDEEEMGRLNLRHRGREGATDVLSFPGSATPEGFYLGDVVICVPVARRQAAERGHSVLRELETLALHGVLHCLGHDHETDGGEMERLERDLRSRWLKDDG
jgi:probable rRNA maturation factor